MLAEIRGDVALRCAADAQALPFPDSSFNTALCMHVLYHVPNISHAIAELRRVTKADGIVLVATNGAGHQRRLRVEFDKAVADLSGGDVRPLLDSARRFRLESGADLLRPHFHSVAQFDLQRELVVPEVQPIFDYLNSIRSFHEAKLPPGVTWEDAMTRLGERVQSEIDKKGAFRSPTVGGIFVCQAGTS